MKYCIVILSFCISALANANETKMIFRKSDLETLVFQGQVLAEGGITFARAELNQRYQLAQQAMADFMDKEALQKLLASNQKSRVFDQCTQITSKRYDFDWETQERDLISWCLEVMAKSVSIPEQYTSLSQESRIFSRRVKPTDLETVELDPSIHKNAEYILVNGLEVGIASKKIKVPRRGFRMTVLTSSHTPLTEYLDSAQLKYLKLSKSEFVFGDCDTGLSLLPTLITTITPQTTVMAMAKYCTNTIKKDQVLPSLKVASTPVSKIEPSTSLFESKWLWIGIGSVLAYQLVNKDSGGGNPPPPTSKRGF